MYPSANKNVVASEGATKSRLPQHVPPFSQKDIPPQFHRPDAQRLLNTTPAPDSNKYTQEARGKNQVLKSISNPCTNLSYDTKNLPYDQNNTPEQQETGI
jgi:hypothetical protein